MRKSTLVALGVFAVLLVAAFWAINRKAERGISRLSFAAVPVDRIDRIEVAGATPIDLKKETDAWHIATTGREADPDAVKNLLNNTTRIVSSEVVTQDASRFAEFEVDDAKGHPVKLSEGPRVVAEFVVGKAITGGAAVRLGDSVYRVANLFPGAFTHPAQDWLQRRLVADKVEDVLRVNVHVAGEAPYTLVLKEKHWALADETHLPPGFRFDPQAAQTLVASLVSLRAQDILDQDPGVAATHLTPDADQVTWFLRDKAIEAQGGANKEVSRTIVVGGPKEDKGQYARLEGRPDVFVLPTYAAASVRKKLTDLRDTSVMAPIDTQQVATLVITDGKKRVTFSKDNGTWRLPRGDKTPAGFVLDPTKIERRISAVVHARAVGVASTQAPGPCGLTAPRGSVSLALEDKSVVTLKFGNPAPDQPNSVYVQGTADGAVYFAANYLRDTLLGGLETFKKDPTSDADPLTQLDPKTLAGLPPDVRASLEQQIAQKRREQEMLKTIQQQQQQQQQAAAPH